VWTTECVGGHNSSRKQKGQPQVKECEDNTIASLDTYRRKWLSKKQRKSEERGAYDNDVGRGEIQRMDGINLATQSMNEDQNKVRSTYYKTRMNEIY
jgi:hypothetical protein